MRIIQSKNSNHNNSDDKSGKTEPWRYRPSDQNIWLALGPVASLCLSNYQAERTWPQKSKTVPIGWLQGLFVPHLNPKVNFDLLWILLDSRRSQYISRTYTLTDEYSCLLPWSQRSPDYECVCSRSRPQICVCVAVNDLLTFSGYSIYY